MFQRQKPIRRQIQIQGRTPKKYWKEEFKRDIKSKMQASSREYNKYKQTNNIIYLQQAGNKLFSITENYMMLKYKTRKFSFKSIYNIVKSDERDEALLKDAYQLHCFFYNGQLDMPKWMAEKYYINIKAKLKARLDLKEKEDK